MIQYEIDIVKKYYEEGSNNPSYKTHKDSISLPDNVKEITLKKWSEFHLRRLEMPKWFTEVEALPIEEREGAQMKWNEEQWAEYFLNVADLLSVFADKDLRILLGNPIAKTIDPSSGDGILAMYVMLVNVINRYKAEKISEFTHKGKKFILPADLIDSLGKVWTGAHMNTMTAIEALQVEHILNAKNSDGEYALKDRKYQTDLALIASLSRMVVKEKKGRRTLEAMPLEFTQRRKWLDRRIKFFGDVKMDVGLNVSFFLLNSKRTSMNTLIYNSLLRTLLTTYRKQQKS